MLLLKQPKARILVVEDDTALLRGLLDVLVFNGYEVKGAEDGGLGLRVGVDEQFDLILLDVMLPTLDGFSICKEIRKEKPTQGIIIITAKGAEDDIVTGFKAGADDYITKPFSLREVMVRVESVLRRTGKNIGDEEVHCRDIFFDGKNLVARIKDHSVEGYYHLPEPSQGPDCFQKGAAHRSVALCRRRHRNPYGGYPYA
jgi:DNA-binding response OmpR family regulator